MKQPEKLRKNYNFDNFTLLNFINMSSGEKEIVRKWRNSKEIRKWMYQEHIITPNEHKKFLQSLKIDNKNFYWLVKIVNRNPIGVISLNKLDHANKNAYLGIYVNPDSEIKGKGSMLINCLKKLAFNKVGLHSLRLEVIENNDGAVSFYEKNGFVKEGRLKDFVFKDRRWRDVLVMGITTK